MNVVSDDIKDMLVADSALGLDFDAHGNTGNLYIGKEPSTPKNTVTIFDTAGYPPQLTMDVAVYEYPSFQIRIRNKNYIVGMGLAQDIVKSLHGRAQETWNGTLYSVIYCSSGPALMDWDDNGNARIVINFNLQRR